MNEVDHRRLSWIEAVIKVHDKLPIETIIVLTDCLIKTSPKGKEDE